MHLPLAKCSLANYTVLAILVIASLPASISALVSVFVNQAVLTLMLILMLILTLTLRPNTYLWRQGILSTSAAVSRGYTRPGSQLVQSWLSEADGLFS